MKTNNLYTLLILAMMGLMVTACQKTYEKLVPVVGTPGGGLLASSAKSYTSDTLVFETDLFVVNRIGNFIENLEEENFSLALGNARLIGVEAFSANTCDSTKGAYSAALLLDQSGSIKSTDPNDARIDGGIAFINAMGGEDEIALAYFEGPGSGASAVLSDFSQKKKDLRNDIETLSDAEGGDTPLYRAIVETLDYVDQNASNNNKAVVVFTDGQASSSSYFNTAINSAQEKGISIYPVGLKEVNTVALSDLAFETGGAMLFADDAIQLVSLYSSLDEILNGNSLFYRIRWKVERDGGYVWGDNDVLSGNVKVEFGEGVLVNIPVRVRL